MQGLLEVIRFDQQVIERFRKKRASMISSEINGGSKVGRVSMMKEPDSHTHENGKCPGRMVKCIVCFGFYCSIRHDFERRSVMNETGYQTFYICNGKECLERYDSQPENFHG